MTDIGPTELPDEYINVDGTAVKVTFHAGERQITLDEFNLANATNGATLRAACKGEDLPFTGTNATKARRLVAAGLTHAQVEERYGWRARTRIKD